MTKVLVVEDDQDIRELLVDSLIDLGFDVTEAEDGGAGLQSALEETPDIILLDVMMPVMDGFQVLSQLRENPDTQSVRVIMVSAKSQEQDIANALNAGAYSYIIKPWEPEELESKVLNAVAKIKNVA